MTSTVTPTGVMTQFNVWAENHHTMIFRAWHLVRRGQEWNDVTVEIPERTGAGGTPICMDNIEIGWAADRLVRPDRTEDGYTDVIGVMSARKGKHALQALKRLNWKYPPVPAGPDGFDMERPTLILQIDKDRYTDYILLQRVDSANCL